MIKVFFTGRLGADAEVKQTKDGKTFTTFRAVSSKKFKNRSGEVVQQATWLRFIAWNGVASGIAPYLVKGKEVKIIGSLESNDYEDENGNKRTSYEVNVIEVELGAGGDEPADDPPARKAAPKKSSKRSFDEDDEDAPF